MSHDSVAATSTPASNERWLVKVILPVPTGPIFFDENYRRPDSRGGVRMSIYNTRADAEKALAAEKELLAAERRQLTEDRETLERLGFAKRYPGVIKALVSSASMFASVPADKLRFEVCHIPDINLFYRHFS